MKNQQLELISTTKNLPKKKSKITNRIYKNIDEWYHIEIDHHELVKNFLNTHTYYSSFIGEPRPSMINLLEHAKVWEKASYNEGVKDLRIRGGKQQIFQFYSKQFNDALANAIKECNPKLILDVCAGDGNLPKILSTRNLPIKAVDNYSWPFINRYFPIEKMDLKEGIDKYQPDFIIGCWMPLGSDWTTYFRKSPSVKHYLIIGEGQEGCTGGNLNNHRGWKKKTLHEVMRWGIARTDMIMQAKELSISPYSLLHTTVTLFSKR